MRGFLSFCVKTFISTNQWQRYTIDRLGNFNEHLGIRMLLVIQEGVNYDDNAQ